MVRHCRERNRRGLGQRVAIRAGAQRGQGDGAAARLVGQAQARGVGRTQQGGILRRAAIDRRDGVDDPARRQQARPGDHRAAGGTAADAPALRQDARPAGPVDRAVHPAAAGQAAVRGIDQRIGGHARNIALL